MILNSVIKTHDKASNYLPVGLSLIVGVGLSVAAAAMVWKSEIASTKARFDRQKENLAVTLQQKIEDYEQNTESMGAFYDASDNVTRADFKQFAQHGLERYPGITGIAWGKLVLGNQRSAYEQAMQAEGFANLRITERNEQGEFITASERDRYMPITYGEPLQNYQELLGYDIVAEQTLIAAVEKARNTGEMVATERFVLLTKVPGFVLLRPVYLRDGPKDTLSDRRSSFVGIVYTVYELAEMVSDSIKGLNLNHLDFYLRDESAQEDNRFLIFYDSQTGDLVDEGERPKRPVPGRSFLCRDLTNCTYSIKVANHSWSLVILPTSSFAGTRWHTLATLAIGLLLTSVLVVYLGMAIGRRVEIERSNLALERSQLELSAKAMELEQALEQLQRTQSQLVQTEKMSSLGQLVAGVAHEINNPVSFIYGNINHVEQYSQDLLNLLKLYNNKYPHPPGVIQELVEEIDMDFVIADLPKTLSSMKFGAERIQKIVLSLRNFSRMDEAQMKSVDIHEGIESTLMILQSRLQKTDGDPGIILIKEYGNLPPVECYPGHLNQVFINILSNAIDALEMRSPSSVRVFSSTITIRTLLLEKDSHVAICIADNGPGMTQEVLDRMFNPFFTTKPVGKGTGLGLAISYQIVVEKHGGQLKCSSEPGRGTEFSIEIPICQICK
ncbi:MAG: CHASE domain-containing protein [Hormoscilla sp.]